MTAKEVIHKCQMTWYFAGVLTLVTAVLLFIGTNVIANDQQSRGRDITMDTLSRDRDEVLRQEIMQSKDKVAIELNLINKALGRIEGKLGN